MHRDFAPEQPAGWHWELGDELRESAPVYFNTFAQGYWVFTRHDAVRDIYKTAGPVLQRVDHAVAAEPDLPLRADADRRPGPHQVPPDRQPVVLAEGDGGGRAGDAGPVPAARRGRRRERRVRLRRRVRAALPHRGVPQRRRHRYGRRRPVRHVGRGLLPRLRRRPRRPGGDGRRRSTGSASTGSPRWPSAGTSRSRARAISPRTCSTRRSTTARSPTPSCSTC